MHLIKRVPKPEAIAYLVGIKPKEWVWGSITDAKEYKLKKAQEISKLIKSPTKIINKRS